jgi:hypothetical protein
MGYAASGCFLGASRGRGMNEGVQRLVYMIIIYDIMIIFGVPSEASDGGRQFIGP